MRGAADNAAGLYQCRDGRGVTRRSGAALGLEAGRQVFALIKTVAIDRRSLGRQAGIEALEDGVEIFDS